MRRANSGNALITVILPILAVTAAAVYLVYLVLMSVGESLEPAQKLLTRLHEQVLECQESLPRDQECVLIAVPKSEAGE